MDFEPTDLRLSLTAARNLYSGKVKSEVVNLLLKSERFAMLTTMLASNVDSTFTAGYAAQNQLLIWSAKWCWA